MVVCLFVSEGGRALLEPNRLCVAFAFGGDTRANHNTASALSWGRLLVMSKHTECLPAGYVS